MTQSTLKLDIYWRWEKKTRKKACMNFSHFVPEVIYPAGLALLCTRLTKGSDKSHYRLVNCKLDITCYANSTSHKSGAYGCKCGLKLYTYNLLRAPGGLHVFSIHNSSYCSGLKLTPMLTNRRGKITWSDRLTCSVNCKHYYWNILM